MVGLRRFRISCPNSGLLFLIAGMAVANYSYENYQQKYLNRGGRSQQADTLNTLAESVDEDVVLSAPVAGPDQHPLDPLSALELHFISRIIREHDKTSQWQFKYIGLLEPDKTLIYPYFQTRTTPPAGLIPRRAKALITDPVKRIPIQIVVNLSTRKVEDWTEFKGHQIGAITTEDHELSKEIALNNPEVQSRLKAKKIGDLSKVIGDTWDAGYAADESEARKLVKVYLYVTNNKEGNNYFAHPVGFVVTVELGPNVVRSIKDLPIQQDIDTSDRTGDSVPTQEAEFFSHLLPPNFVVPSSNRLQISQPSGPSFKIAGKEVTWLNLNFRIGYSPREGFNIHTLTYKDQENGRIRPLIYRLSIAEAYLSSGDLRPPYDRKSSFDVGNGEFGSRLRTLPVHQFCRGNPTYLESSHHNEKGQTWILKNSLCIVEEDAGILWAHSDEVSGKTEAIRNIRLVLSSLVTLGNIDYWISWRLYKDATIELAIKATGILSTHLMAVDVKDPLYGNLVMPQVYAPNYQHIFAVRVDPDIDGLENTVSKEDIVQGPNGFKIKSVDLTTPFEAGTNSLPNRIWRISNPNVAPSKISGKAPSWKLIPQGPVSPILLPEDSPLIQSRLSWAKHNLWVLPYNSEQIYASGLFLDTGVANWTMQNPNANIKNTDVVLWHVFNYAYVPDEEDWPILSSIEPIGFKLRPSRFFSENPALHAARAKETTLLDGIHISPSAHGSSREL